MVSRSLLLPLVHKTSKSCRLISILYMIFLVCLWKVKIFGYFSTLAVDVFHLFFLDSHVSPHLNQTCTLIQHHSQFYNTIYNTNAKILHWKHISALFRWHHFLSHQVKLSRTILCLHINAGKLKLLCKIHFYMLATHLYKSIHKVCYQFNICSSCTYFIYNN